MENSASRLGATYYYILNERIVCLYPSRFVLEKREDGDFSLGDDKNVRTWQNWAKMAIFAYRVK